VATTTAKGYRKPSTGDRGWYTDLEFNIDRSDAHRHDGVDSVTLSSTIITKTTQDALAASWVAQGEGTFKQTLTMPASFTFNDMQVRFYVNGGTMDGQEVLLSVKKVSATTFDIYTGDNTLALKAVYG